MTDVKTIWRSIRPLLSDKYTQTSAVGLCYFMIHHLMIHDPTMHNSCVNYSNKHKLCRESYATVKLNSAE